MSDLGNLKIVHWNVCGLRRKTRHLRALLHAKHIDVALISETKLRDRVGLRLKGYCVYRQDKLSADQACHGLLVAVKRTIPHKLLPRLNLASMDALGIQLDRFDGAPLRVYAVYKPPKTSLMTSDIDALLRFDCPTIAAGDMNSKHSSWNSVVENPSGEKLYKHCHLRGYSVDATKEFTYYPYRKDRNPDVLDIIMHRGQFRGRPVQAVHEERFGSDHCPVLVNY